MKRMMMTAGLAAALIFGAPTQQAHADNGTMGTIIGAVGGGLLGSAFGKGRGKTVATAAGTLIGAVIGHEMATANANDYEPRKRTVYRDRPRDVVVYRDPPKKKKKWKRVVRYGDDVLICNRNGKRCHWDD